MVKIYQFIKKYINGYFGLLFSYLMGVVSEFLSRYEFVSSTKWIDFFLDFVSNISFIIFIIFLFLGIGMIIVKSFLLTAINENRVSSKFYDLMNIYSEEIIIKNEHNHQGLVNLAKFDSFYGVYWGFDGAIIRCKNIMEGWSPRKIKINLFDPSLFSFDSVLDGRYNVSDSDFNLYANSIDKKIRENNFERWMLTEFKLEHNESNMDLTLCLKKTNWMQLNYIWNYKLKNEYNRKLEIQRILDKGYLLPNSLCLHLVILTKTNQIVLSQISREKDNDYPERWAATLGEQICRYDFTDGSMIMENFIYDWVKRALKEEMAFESEDFDEIIDKNSIRILSLNLETDIINFSLCTVVKLNYTFDELLRHLKVNSHIICEMSNFKAIKYTEIPKVLMGTHSEIRYLHPSTHLRLLLVLAHLQGFSNTMKMMDKERKRIKRF